MATTILFTLMMDACSRERAASDYSAQACTVVVSQSLAASFSGVAAQALGYGIFFGVSAVIGFVGVTLTALILQKDKVRKLITPLCLILISSNAFAQTAPSSAAEPESFIGGIDTSTFDKSEQIGVHGGPLMIEGFVGLTEFINAYGFRASVPTNKGTFEVDTIFGRGSGETYNSFSGDFNLPVKNPYILTHALLGVHADEFTPSYPHNAAAKFSGGWHFGGGFSIPFSQTVQMRTDLKYRFGPAVSVYLGIGIMVALPGGGTN
jgi:hypothetical protein